MKILFLATHLNYGGISSYILTLAEELSTRDIKVFIASSGGVLEGKLESLGIKHIKIPILTKSEINPKLLVALVKLIKFVNKNNIQIIHANTRVTQVLGALCRKFSGVKLITTAHGFYKVRLGRTIFACWGDRTIAISNPVKNHLVNDFKLDSNIIRIINNGIDTKRFNPLVKSRYSKIIEEKFNIKKRPIIGAISRLSDVKGIEYILIAIKKLKKDYKNITCLIIGSGKESQKLKNLVKDLDIEENVKLIPSLWEIEKMLSVVDIFMCASLQEGLGLSLIEAMACGVGVVATRAGGIVDVIQDRHNGLLSEIKDADSLARNVRILLENKALYGKISQNAALTAKDNFNINKMANLTTSVYSEVL